MSRHFFEIADVSKKSLIFLSNGLSLILPIIPVWGPQAGIMISITIIWDNYS